MAWFSRKPHRSSETLPSLLVPPRGVPETEWAWRWDDHRKVMTGRWTNGPPAEPPDLREPVLHSAFQEQELSGWSGCRLQGRRSGSSWWDRRG
jgi:hypothetical protein